MNLKGGAIMEVSTWSDLTVNKQEMFDTLQKDFFWDIYSIKTYSKNVLFYAKGEDFDKEE